MLTMCEIRILLCEVHFETTWETQSNFPGSRLWLANPVNIQPLHFDGRWFGINSLLQKMSG